ncbi:hypothetical protein WCP94_001872 [Bilophila wadsworthia]
MGKEGRGASVLREMPEPLSNAFSGKEEARYHKVPGFFYLLSAKPRAA